MGCDPNLLYAFRNWVYMKQQLTLKVFTIDYQRAFIWYYRGHLYDMRRKYEPSFVQAKTTL